MLTAPNSAAASGRRSTRRVIPLPQHEQRRVALLVPGADERAPQFHRRPEAFEELRLEAEQLAGVKAFDSEPRQHVSGEGQPVGARQAAVGLVPQKQVLIMAVEPVQVGFLSAALANLPERDFTLPADFPEGLRDFRRARQENGELAVLQELVVGGQGGHLRRQRLLRDFAPAGSPSSAPVSSPGRRAAGDGAKKTCASEDTPWRERLRHSHGAARGGMGPPIRACTVLRRILLNSRGRLMVRKPGCSDAGQLKGQAVCALKEHRDHRAPRAQGHPCGGRLPGRVRDRVLGPAQVRHFAGGEHGHQARRQPASRGTFARPCNSPPWHPGFRRGSWG